MKTNVRNERTITTQELVTILSQVDKGQPVYIVMRTEPSMNKTNNPYFDKVKKETEGRFWVGTEYEKRVKNNMIKQGLNPDDFQVSINKVGEHFSKCVLFNQNKNEYYIQLEYFKQTPPKVNFLDNSIEDVLKNSFLSEETKKEIKEKVSKDLKEGISNFLTKHSTSKKQEDLGIEKPVVWLSPKISNIKQITYNRTRYTIEN